MRSNSTFKQFQTMIAASTESQVNAVTKTQAESTLGVTMTDTFLANMKSLVINDLNEADFQTKFDRIKDQLVGGGSVWLTNNYPAVEFEKGRQDGKRFVTIWLDGKPQRGDV